MKLTSSAQEARCIAWTPAPSTGGNSNASQKEVKSVACMPPFATENDIPQRPTKAPRERIDPTKLDRFAGLDSIELFHLEEPRGPKPIPRDGSHVFGSPSAFIDDVQRQYKTVESWQGSRVADPSQKNTSRLKSSAQEARVALASPQSPTKKPGPVAIRPPYATEDKRPKLPTKKLPERLDVTKQPRVAGLDSISLFYIAGPRGVKPVGRPGSNIFGSADVGPDEADKKEKLYWKTSYSAFDGQRGEFPKATSEWLWHPYNRPIAHPPYAPDKPGPPEYQKEKPDKPVAGLNSAELSAVQDIPMPRGVKRVPLPPSNIFGVDPDEPFSTGQEVGYRFPSMIQVNMLERQLKPHQKAKEPHEKAKDERTCSSCSRSLKSQSLHHSHSAPDVRHHHHTRRRRSQKGVDKFGQTF